MATGRPESPNLPPGELLPRLIADARSRLARARSAASGRRDRTHDVRKRLKEFRATLRLLREVIGEAAFARLNAAARDAARSVSARRDARAIVATLDLIAPVPVELRAELTARVPRDRPAASARGSIAEIESAVAAWPRAGGDFDVIAPALRKAYRRARDRLDDAARAAGPARAGRESPWHEARKRAKDLRYQLELFAPYDKRIAKLASRAKKLGDALGEAHDLAVLRQALRGLPAPIRRLPGMSGLTARIDTARAKRHRRAEKLGRKLFAKKPKRFVARIEKRLIKARSDARG